MRFERIGEVPFSSERKLMSTVHTDAQWTMAFNTLMLFQIFNVLNARSDERSAFRDLFHNRWLWGALLLSLGLQVLVISVPFLQQAFATVGLSLRDWVVCAGVASSVLWLRELSKIVTRRIDQRRRRVPDRVTLRG